MKAGKILILCIPQYDFCTKRNVLEFMYMNTSYEIYHQEGLLMVDDRSYKFVIILRSETRDIKNNFSWPKPELVISSV